jgi:PAS domain S-box-containing protein
MHAPAGPDENVVFILILNNIPVIISAFPVGATGPGLMITVVCASSDPAYPGQVREVLEQDGDIRVRTVTSGRDALTSLPSCDAIVADMSPEDMDGIELLRAVRETSRIPFIVLADASDREEDAIAAGADFFFLKPPDTRQAHSIARWIRRAVSRSRDEAGLRENEAKYHELIENANLIILKLDRDSKITFINEYARNYFGLKKDEVPDKLLAETILSAIGTDPVREMGYFVRDVGTRTDRYTVRETEHVKKNGVRVWISWRNKPLLDRNNTIVGVISFGTDMTERRKAEQALFRANEKLKLLNSITRHDILNELTVLGGYIGMTRELSNDKEMLDFIEHEKKAAKAIRNMIKFTKDYQDIGLYRPQWQYLKNIVSLLANTIDFGDVILRNDLGRLEIYADPLFEKVVYSLLENAIRHGGQLTFIRLSYRIGNYGCVVICEDNGVGVPDEDKEKIFLREFGKHTGFGLFLSREILSITGFSIRETGIHGNGARFEIYIPEGSFRENKA